MPKFQGGGRTVSCASQKREGDERAVSAFDAALMRHLAQQMQNLIKAWDRPVPLRLGDHGVLLGKREILRIAVTQPRPETGLASKPKKEGFERRQRPADRCLAQGFAGNGIALF